MLIFPQHDWRLIGFRGFITVIFGIVILAVPEITLKALIIVFGIYVLLDSLFTVFSAIRSRKKLKNWQVPFVKGILGVSIAVLIIVLPGISGVVLAYILGAWFVLLGVAEIVTAFRLRKETEGEGRLMAAGVLSAAVGIFLFVRPTVSMVAVTLIIGIFALLFGVILIVHAWRKRRLQLDL